MVPAGPVKFGAAREGGRCGGGRKARGLAGPGWHAGREGGQRAPAGRREGQVRAAPRGLERCTARRRCGLEWVGSRRGGRWGVLRSPAETRARRQGCGPARLGGWSSPPPLLRGAGVCDGWGWGGLASCRARRKVFNMAAGAPGPLCGGGVGPKLPSPERPTLRTRVPHHHLVPRPPGVPGASWGRGAASATGGGEEPPVRSGAAWLSGGGVCKDWGGGHFEDCGAGPGQAAGFLMLAWPGGRTLPRGLRAAPLCSRERPGWG